MSVLLKSSCLWPEDQAGAPGPKRYLHLYFGCDLDKVRLCPAQRKTAEGARVSTEPLCASVAKSCVLGKDCFHTEQSVQNWCRCGGMMAHWSVQ